MLEQIVDPWQEITQREGLGYVVVCAFLECTAANRGIRDRRLHDNRNVRPSPEVPDQTVAAQTGQTNIQQDQVRAFACTRKPTGSGSSRFDLVSSGRQATSQRPLKG